MAALLAPLLSIAILSGKLFSPIALSKSLSRNHLPLCRQQKVHGLSLLFDNAIEIFPGALDLDAGFIHPSATADRPLVFWGGVFSISGRNRIAHRLIYEWSTDAPRSSIISSLPVAQRAGHIPADAEQDHIDRKEYPF